MKCTACQEVDTGGTLGSGLSRRDFMKVCTAAAVYMGLDASFGAQIAEAAAAKRLPVIWITGQDCTGCTETLLRATHPTLEHLILDLISLDYHETLQSGCGKQANDALDAAIAAGGYVLVAEGSFPMKDGGIYCKINGEPVVDILARAGKNAAACIAIGSCSSWGGMPSADPNPTGAVSAAEVFKTKGLDKLAVMNIPGCPPNPYNFLSAVLYFVTFGKLPELDDKGRPKFAYGRLIHENCERRAHFDAGRFAEKFGDKGHGEGYCLYKLGCKGPETWNNCSTLTFGDVGASSWPVGMGAPCFGCSEQGVGYTVGLHSPARLLNVTPPAFFSPIAGEKGGGATIAAAAVAAAVVGAVVGAGLATTKSVGQAEDGKK
jgi:hydrogenase small subunit